MVIKIYLVFLGPNTQYLSYMLATAIRGSQDISAQFILFYIIYTNYDQKNG